MIFFYFLKIIFKIITSKQFKTYKKINFRKCTVKSDLKNSTSTLIQFKVGEEPKNHLWIV